MFDANVSFILRQTAKEAYRMGQERHLAELDHKEESAHALRERTDELLATITTFLQVKASESAVITSISDRRSSVSSCEYT